MSHKNIQVGAYGWLSPHWQGVFYPDDMPPEWCLAYYSNEFNTVMVPADYWQEDGGFGCEEWLDDIHDDFRFYIEYPQTVLPDEAMFGLFLEQLDFLSSHLAGVWLPEQSVEQVSVSHLQQIVDKTKLFSQVDISGVRLEAVWQVGFPTNDELTELAIFEDDLSQLRQTRVNVEAFSENSTTGKHQDIIVKHETLSAADLMKFRSVIEIMGL